MTNESNEFSGQEEGSLPEKIVLPSSLKELAYRCVTQAPIGENMQLFPGRELVKRLQGTSLNCDHLLQDEHDSITSVYGVRLLDKKTRRAMVKAGFWVDDSVGVMYISNPPQGYPPESRDLAERNRLTQRNFRRDTTHKIIELARSLDLHAIKAQSAAFNQQVLDGLINLESEKFFDSPYREEIYFGKKFQYEFAEEGMWVYRLR